MTSIVIAKNEIPEIDVDAIYCLWARLTETMNIFNTIENDTTVEYIPIHNRWSRLVD